MLNCSSSSVPFLIGRKTPDRTNDTLSLAEKLTAAVARRIEAEKALKVYLEDIGCPKTRASSSLLHARLQKFQEEEDCITSAIEAAGGHANKSTFSVISMPML